MWLNICIAGAIAAFLGMDYLDSSTLWGILIRFALGFFSVCIVVDLIYSMIYGEPKPTGDDSFLDIFFFSDSGSSSDSSDGGGE